MDVWKLTAVGGASERFKAIAQKAFSAKYRDAQVSFHGKKLWRVEECLRLFGSSITSAWCDCDGIVLRLLLDYCQHLVVLTCDVHHQQTIDALRTVMPRLR